MSLNQITKMVWDSMNNNTKEAEPYFIILGWFLIISYIGFYFFNKLVSSPGIYENFNLRLLISALGIGLIFYQHWTTYLKSISVIYFYITILISFPFFFIFMLLHNQDSIIWHVNGLVGLVLLSAFVDWISFFVLSFIGIALAILFSYNISLPFSLIITCSSYIVPLLYLIILFKKRAILQEEKNTYTSKIKKLNEDLEQKVQQRTKELENALAVKTEFLNNMSHEIRTPVHGFTALSEGLTKSWNILNDEKKYKYTKDISTNAKRLETLISSILDLSKFTADKMVLNFKEVDFNEIIENIIDECNGLYLSKKHINIEYNSNGKLMITSDYERLSQVLRNLFFNAIKFTPDNGHIKASYTITRDKHLHFIISDSGIGIPEQELETIFEPFTQSSYTKTSAGGTGLGLGICQNIIKAHSGNIWASNNSQEGASFHFSIPITQKGSVQRPTSFKKFHKNVLMIDDEEICRTSMEILLLDTEYSLTTINGGRTGIKYLKQHASSIDIVLLDLMMVDMNGIDFFKQMKTDPKLSKIPVILQSGTSNQDLINEAYKAGISSFLRKPYQKKDILLAIQKSLSN